LKPFAQRDHLLFAKLRLLPTVAIGSLEIAVYILAASHEILPSKSAGKQTNIIILQQKADGSHGIYGKIAVFARRQMGRLIHVELNRFAVA
jgi:hypothetical protein